MAESAPQELDDKSFRLRSRPTQKRARETFELILTTAAMLLEEVGFDKLNTNLICKRAKMTPPALYRYFPNKYAILEELGSRLMEEQNDSSFRWMEDNRDKKITAEMIAQLLREQYEITRDFTGAKWIMRSLRSVPALANVRLKSHALMISRFTEWNMEKVPGRDAVAIERRARIANEIGYALIEMLLDGDDDDADAIFADAGAMLTGLR